MRTIFKYFFILVTLSLHIVLVGSINYAFPSYEETIVTGMEAKRVDKDGPISKSNPADGQIRDAYFIFTENPDTKKIMVYRNEDTGWGLPFYFKFNSADVQAKAQAYANDKQLVQVKYYGWRINMLSEFRNIISIKPLAEAEKVSRPIFSYILYILLLLTFFVSVQMIRGWFDSEK
ncbi:MULTISPECIES: DUF1523 family protein [Pasteurellaceae]|uniref:DUF1523 family protein n=1 Tax=Pasteurella atlantica TaxID=2827233 RepID=A0AAW8CKE6_9PAST|nr:DUF1523 family protein [Pasteurella atlantica]MBR0574608.1 DUF1523 family protein [Pasteurella atlantica]MDP8040515.1 DUF1523 family protein [Pasteurella atlantica]MDP8042650.1 DUF1523 family protein [Pasteurella atlantica]MDP8044753.1 DUF1523 family protein [Pasteurella atlantica]MDP8046831.1 DUF1523 family protein [Pasteurella atlantica]